MNALFFDHPREQGETYIQHGIAALAGAVKLLCITTNLVVATGILVCHAIVPGCCQRTASGMLRTQHKHLENTICTLTKRSVARETIVNL
jgi:hypothetical protein